MKTAENSAARAQALAVLWELFLKIHTALKNKHPMEIPPDVLCSCAWYSFDCPIKTARSPNANHCTTFFWISITPEKMT